MKIKYLILGAGISGLSFAENLSKDQYIILEKSEKVGGYCGTTLKNDYVWDYAGHFFHFQDEQLKAKFIEKIGEQNFVRVNKNTKIFYNNLWVDYPFQKNIHELPRDEFIDCLYDLYNKVEKDEYDGFLDMLYGKFGKSIVEKFLKPYNEKLYACDLNKLDVDAMGRFFPYADLKDIIENMKHSNQKSYNDSFLYPKKGAMEFINALNIDKDRIVFNSKIVSIDMKKKVVYTNDEQYEFECLISTIPLNSLLEYLDIQCDLSWNKVLVFNVGFDKKTNYTDIHWVYVPQKDINFYRLGFYDNILGANEGSVYIEIGYEKDDVIDIGEEFEKTLDGLKKMEVIDSHIVVDYEAIIMDPAYVHIKDVEKIKKVQGELNENSIFLLGRYGSWTYCSVEDCVRSAISLKEDLV